MISSKNFHTDKSVALLVFSNIVTIIFAVFQKWDIGYIMRIYWWQSVIIGCFNWRRILDLKQFSTEGVRMNDRPVEPTRATQVQMAWFFLFHYGFFHLVYFLFLTQEKKILPATPVLGIVICVLMFLINHAFSYSYNRECDAKRVPNIGTIMLFPYARIIPMHLTIIFGGIFVKGSGLELVLFLGLKTLADVVMHMVEHAENKSSTFNIE